MEHHNQVLVTKVMMVQAQFFQLLQRQVVVEVVIGEIVHPLLLQDQVDLVALAEELEVIMIQVQQIQELQVEEQVTLLQ